MFSVHREVQEAAKAAGKRGVWALTREGLESRFCLSGIAKN